MRRLAWSAWAGLACAVAWMPAAASAQGCRMGVMAELPVTMADDRPMVSAKFGQQDARFIMDSGAFHSTLSRASAAEFGLRITPAPDWFRVSGIGGDSRVWTAESKAFSLAGIPLPKVSFVVAGSDTGEAGLLGQNILGLADVEYDLPHGKVKLVKLTGCGDRALAYWAGDRPFSTVALERGEGPFKPHSIGTVLVNGVKMRAMFDSGAEFTLITLAAAKRAGVTPTTAGVLESGAAVGMGSGVARSWRGKFDRIDIGGEQVPGPTFHIVDTLMEEDMLIGIDFFLTHRMFVSNATRRLYFTYEGGPFFGLKPRGARVDTGEKIDLTDTTAAPTDAAGFSRRAAVLASHGKIPAALADLDKAVEMAPKDGRYRYQRAQARLAADQRDAAAKDLDEAAALAPDDAEIRMVRAGLRLDREDRDGAAADVAAANRVLAPSSDRRLTLAGLYNALGRPADAVANYDLWLKLHREDSSRAQAYNGRCWSRALMNSELDRALDDCNTALRYRPGAPAFLDSRALVALRQGRIDAALKDYDAVLKADPKAAWSLYARSIAAARAGRDAQAAVDRKAALAIDPKAGETAERYGIK